jgi:hypothetical protein
VQSSRSVKATLRKICRTLKISIDGYVGFDPQGFLADPEEAAARVGEFIGYYLMHTQRYSPEVKAQIAGLILRTIDSAGHNPVVRELVEDFLNSTCREWKSTVPVLEHYNDHPVFDYCERDIASTIARREISTDLHLKFPVHDWELANADSARVAEFIAYFNSMTEQANDETRKNAIQLIACSIDSAISQGNLAHSTRELAQKFLMTLREPTDRGCYYVRWPLDCTYLEEPSLNDFGWGGRYHERRDDISKELNLQYPAVDWCRYNADPERLKEFVEHYFSGWAQCKHIEWHAQMGDLILASLDTLVMLRDPTAEERNAAERLIREHRGDQASNLARWARTGSRRMAMLVSDAILTCPRQGTELKTSFYECQETGRGGYVVEYYLNVALQLTFSGQDWGICNSRPDRLAEFIRYYLDRRNYLRIWPGWLENLIYASLDDALRAGPLDSDTAALTQEFLGVATACPSSRTEYWKKWPGPAGMMLRGEL